MDMKCLFSIAFTFITFIINAQDHDILVRFGAIVHKDNIILNWTIARNQSCIGIGILRSADGISYTKIGEIQGICGSNTEDQHYTFIDEKPLLNSYNYYKLELGFNGKSKASDPVYFFSLDNDLSKVFPNPTNDYSYIYFNNPSNLTHNLYVYSAGSALVSHQSTNQEFFHVQFTQEQLYHSKFLFYVITNKMNEKIASGRILTLSH